MPASPGTRPPPAPAQAPPREPAFQSHAVLARRRGLGACPIYISPLRIKSARDMNIEKRAEKVIIENPVINSPFTEPCRHFKFDDDGITDQIVCERRPS